MFQCHVSLPACRDSSGHGCCAIITSHNPAPAAYAMAYSCFIAFAEPHPGSLATEEDVDFAVITHPQKSDLLHQVIPLTSKSFSLNFRV